MNGPDPKMELLPYPFADLSLARRLEDTEAHGNVLFVEARARAFPDSGAKWIEVAGAHAMFDGPTSPVSQTFGLGMFHPVTADTLNTIESFFHERGAEVFHEVSPLADPSTFAPSSSPQSCRSFYRTSTPEEQVAATGASPPGAPPSSAPDP